MAYHGHLAGHAMPTAISRRASWKVELRSLFGDNNLGDNNLGDVISRRTCTTTGMQPSIKGLSIWPQPLPGNTGQKVALSISFR